VDIVTCESLDEFKKVLGSDRITEDTIMVSLSCVIHPDQFPDKYITYFYHLPIIPSPTILNRFYAGDVAEYTEACFDWWYEAPRLIYINEIIYRMCEKECDVILVSSQQEEEFMIIGLLKEFIEKMYDIKALKTKKYLKGKTNSPSKKEMERLLTFTLQQREKLIQIHDSLNTMIHPTMYARYPKKILKKFPKKYKKLTELLVTSDWKGE
jgi:hypothetical protein